MLCKMQIFRICSVLYLLISCVIDVSDAECDEYFVVLEEHICPDGTHYEVTPLKKDNINWDNVTYPCNSTVKDFEKECLVEFNYNSTSLYCETNKKVVNTQPTAGNHSAKSITIRTEAPDVTTNKITDVTDKPNHTLDEEFTASMFDVNLIFINDYTTSKTTQNEILECQYAETVCFDELKQENKSLSDDKNIIYNIHLEELASTLLISINRDATTSIQPIFTGYFSKSSNDSSTHYNGNFKHLKTMVASCSISKHNNCKGNIKINVYFKVNYIENNTITKYPNCTQDPITSKNVLNVKCEDVLFAKYNPHITQTLPTTTPRQEIRKNDYKKKEKEISTNQIFKTKKNFANGATESSLGRESSESEKTMLIALLAVAGAAILMALASQMWPKKKEYHPTPTREPNDEETAF